MPSLTFADHDGFQKAVVRAALGSGAAGLAWSLALPHFFAVLAAPLVAGAAAAGAGCGTGLRAKLAYAALGGLAGTLSFLFPLHDWLGLGPPALQFPTHHWFGLAGAGAALGLLFAHSRQKEARRAPGLGKATLGKAAYAASAALTALGLVAGSAVTQAFESARVLWPLMPVPFADGALTAVLGLFIGLGSAGAHVVRDPDAVEKLYDQLLPELTGDLKVLGARAMTNYRRCAEILASSEAGFARSQLAQSLSAVTLRILELSRRWQAIDRELGDRAEGEIAGRLSELRALQETTRDETAKKQLGVAEASLRAELEQIDRIRRGRERVVARLHGEMALLERSRVTLLGLKTSDAHLRAAELSALSETLSAVAREMDVEAEAVDEVISKVVDVHGSGEAAKGEAKIKA